MATKISKGTKIDVQEFKFGTLRPESEGDVVTSYQPKDLKKADDFKRKISDEVIRVEREFEKKSSFKISGMVREHRGIRAQEDADFERRVEEEVTQRLEAIYQEAKQQGYQEGMEIGKAEAKEEAAREINTLIEALASELASIQENSIKVFEENRERAYIMIKNLTKWVALKEIQDDSYLPKLLEKLILEINSKANLIVRVNPDKFKMMPEIIEKIEERVGTLTNVRLEVKHNLLHDGIILESENGIIDGSLEAQFQSIDKMFEKVGIIDHDNS